jgi:glutathione synthase/RimK-type ligase-like ATP-grasp enzyme
MSLKSSRRPKRKLARVLVRPPTRPSEGAQTIRNLLSDNAKLSRLNPVPKQYHTVINWGNPTGFTSGAGQIPCFNHPAAVAKAINKIVALQALQEGYVRVPEFTTKLEEAKDIWFARTTITGSAGAGIRVVRKGEEIPEAPLYTRYIKKEEEWRVHVAFGQVIFAQIKLRQNGSEQDKDQKLIRNHDNGWVFGPRPIEDLPTDSAEQAIKAVAALSLDFGAVDLVIGKKDNLAYVLEINTAPGIESEGLKAAYKSAFCNKLGLVL